MLADTHVHYADATFDLLDRGGTLYHPNHLVLADRARGGMLEDIGYPLHELWQDGFALMVRNVTSEFLKPVFAGSKLAILSEVALDSARSLTVSQRFVFQCELPKTDLHGKFIDGARVEPGADICRFSTKLVCVNMREVRVDALPERLVEPFRRSVNTQVRRASDGYRAMLAGAPS